MSVSSEARRSASRACSTHHVGGAFILGASPLGYLASSAIVHGFATCGGGLGGAFLTGTNASSEGGGAFIMGGSEDGGAFPACTGSASRSSEVRPSAAVKRACICSTSRGGAFPIGAMPGLARVISTHVAVADGCVTSAGVAVEAAEALLAVEAAEALLAG